MSLVFMAVGSFYLGASLIMIFVDVTDKRVTWVPYAILIISLLLIILKGPWITQAL